MTVETLIKAAPPPTDPFEAYIGPWQPFEAALRTPLPQDYKDFVRLYGNGRFLDFIGVNVPVSRSPYMRLVSDAETVIHSFHSDEECPYPLWPDPGGLLPFGRTDNGDQFFWLCRGAPPDWRVVVWDRGMLEYEMFDCDLTDFLAGIVTGDIKPKAFPDDLLPWVRLFSPYSHRDFGEFRMAWRVSYGGRPEARSVPDGAGQED